MSIQTAANIKCLACDLQVPLQEARSRWWICTTCGSYICPSCRTLILKTSQTTCPGTIVRGIKDHLPHFTRFLGLRHKNRDSDTNKHPRVILLSNIKPGASRSSNGKIIILDDTCYSKNQNTANGQ